MASAAQAVVDQRLETLETMCVNLTKRCEVLNEVTRQLAQNQGVDWKRLVQRAAGEIEARNAREARTA